MASMAIARVSRPMSVGFTNLSLGSKLAWVAFGFLAVALAATSFTLYEAWELEGGAAAINDMGSERMRSYRIGYLLSESLREPEGAQATRAAAAAEMDRFEAVMADMRRGNPGRPLFLPRGEAMDRAVEEVMQEWSGRLRPGIERALAMPEGAPRHQEATALRPQIEAFVGRIDMLVLRIEQSNASAISTLRYLQFGLVVLSLVGTVALVILMFALVVRPLARLKEGMQRMARGELETRLTDEKRDEFGELAEGFNRMASRLQGLYATLEERVAAKTHDLAGRNRELAALYEVARLLNEPASTEELCRSFLRRVMLLHGASGGAVRLMDAATRGILFYAHEGLAARFTGEEHCIQVGECLCGEAAAGERCRVSVLDSVPETHGVHCRRAGFQTVAVVPIRLQGKLLGIFNLFFRHAHRIGDEDRQLLETLGQHLGVAIENQRLASRARELALYEERSLLGRELHDSIAQSLAFLNMQVQMLEDSLARDARDEVDEVLARIREGVQESYEDVRELLTHFRARVKQEEDVGLALRTMLSRFGAQSGAATELLDVGAGLPLRAESRLQVLHILQEALSNVRKHAGARRVELRLERGSTYRFAVSDDGCGFDAQRLSEIPEAHVGLRIMRERAERIGGRLEVRSTIGAGTLVVLAVPVAQTTAPRDRQPAEGLA